jgi:hypothetical protein
VQKNLGHISPVAKLKEWQKTHPELFVKKIYNQSKPDNYLQTEQFQKQKRQFITGTKVRRVNADDLAKILIPVPSPEEQARIVAILDKFDALTHSLTEGLPREIELRQKQYAYYRDLLFSFPKPEERGQAKPDGVVDEGNHPLPALNAYTELKP